jgi:hypothetical protein
MANRKNDKRDRYIWNSLHYGADPVSTLAGLYGITETRVHQIYMEQCAEVPSTPKMLVIPPTNGKERMAIARFNKLIDKRFQLKHGNGEWMGLDAWTVTALKRFGCTDPDKLHMYSSERLLDAPGLGRLRVNRIREALAARNKYLSGELPGIIHAGVVCPHCGEKVEHATWVD